MRLSIAILSTSHHVHLDNGVFRVFSRAFVRLNVRLAPYARGNVGRVRILIDLVIKRDAPVPVGLFGVCPPSPCPASVVYQSDGLTVRPHRYLERCADDRQDKQQLVEVFRPFSESVPSVASSGDCITRSPR